jgi:arylsulfatase A-like enzyme
MTDGDAGPSRPATEGRAPGGAIEGRLGPLALVLLAAWLGLVTGLLELGLWLAQRRLSGAVTLESLRTNRHVLWMTPVADALMLGACGLVLGLGARLWPRHVSRPAAYLLGFLAPLCLLLAVPGLYPIAAVLFAGGFSARVVPRIEAHSRGVRRLVARSLPVLAGLVVLLTGIEATRVIHKERRTLASLPAAAPGAPNVLLIVLDTVRADHLSPYGYGRPTSPNLERLARGGVRFERARATAPWTLPSHASLLTGRWPHELSTTAAQPLDATYPTLAEFLGAHGYATAGFVANTFYCNAWYGLDRGFARYEDFDQNLAVTPGEVLRSSALGRRLARLAGAAADVRPGAQGDRKTAARINRDALEWISGQAGRPFFAFLNYYDAHGPYQPPEGYRRRFGLAARSSAEAEAILRQFHRLGRREDATGREDPRHVAELGRAAAEVRRDGYDDCIAYLDDQLGRLFADLQRRGVLANTLVIVTADHGEHLGDHHLFGHGHSLYRPLLDVPLLIHHPARVPSGRSVRAPVSLRDLPATVADLLGLEAASPFPGRSLALCWGPTSAPVREATAPLLSEVEHQKKFAPSPLIPASRGPLQALVGVDRIYIRNPDGRDELYDLEHDPEEARDLAGAPGSGPVLEQFRTDLERLRQADAATRPRR